MKNLLNGKKEKIEKKEENTSYKILILNGKQIYILGIQKITKFSSEEVVLLLKNSCSLCVYGQGLIICECSKHSIMLSGKVTKTEVVESV